MIINFLEPACQEPAIVHDLFGLCDDNNGNKAYSNFDNPQKWIATVKNPNKASLIFTAVDKCVIKDTEQKDRGRCDGLLTSAEHIYFIELKDERSSWIKGAIEQLESTIQFYIDNHNLSVYKHKKAFACNKQHSKFQETDNELNLHFFRKYKVRIDVQAEIIVI